jgi:hypothetical protein
MGCAACGGSDDDYVGPQVPGSLAVTTATAGFLRDDSYELLVNGTSRGTIAADDLITITGLDPATYEVSLGDVAANCTVQSISVSVAPNQTADAALAVACSYAEPVSYTVRFSRDRPNLDDGQITECSFGICPTNEEWDLWVYNNTSTTPHSVIRQNQTTGVEIAHLPGVTLDELTEEDVAGATFGTALVADPFDAGRVILIRTDVGSVYALGNPVEDLTALTLTFDAAFLTAAP